MRRCYSDRPAPRATNLQRFVAVISRCHAFLGTIRAKRLSTDPLSIRKLSAAHQDCSSSFELPRFGPIGMEQLWNRGGATGGKGSSRQKPQKWLELTGNRCHRLPPAAVWIAW